MNCTILKRITAILSLIVLCHSLSAQSLFGDTTAVYIGDTSNIVVRVTSHDHITITYYKLTFPSVKLNFLGLGDINPALLPNYVISIDSNNINNGELWFLAQDTTGLPITLSDGEPLYTIRFQTIDESAVIISAAVMYDTLADSLQVVVDQGYVNIITGTFPLQWLSQEISCDGVNRVISWSTAQEENIAWFELQDSKDATIWNSVYKLQASGGVSRTDYQLSLPVIMGMRYYRIVAHEHTGTSSMSNLFAKSCGEALSQPRLVPNPMQNYIYLIIDKASNISVTILSETGQVVNSYNFHNTTNGEAIELKPTLIPGTYMFVINIDGNYTTKKIIKTE